MRGWLDARNDGEKKERRRLSSEHGPAWQYRSVNSVLASARFRFASRQTELGWLRISSRSLSLSLSPYPWLTRHHQGLSTCTLLLLLATLFSSGCRQGRKSSERVCAASLSSRPGTFTSRAVPTANPCSRYVSCTAPCYIICGGMRIHAY